MNMRRTPVSWRLAMCGLGLVAGIVVQLARSSAGAPPLVPPASLAATLLVIAAVLIVLAVLLRRAVTRASAREVNPFHAVRLLAGSRAGQLAGALFAGFGGGALLQVLSRTVVPQAATWAPMLAVCVSAIVLVVCGVIAERLCQVPPTDGDGDAPIDESPATGDAGFAP